eukprot:TRINITY_DN59810_c0_g1_i1.p1 TRINITY_DN59810_c0_g1~~TRINITY_DN59810_c0_g1_i1.p1  ORF type:complete len:398 (+),score=73.67 TRINITY_DN59810_c0_g1_i1:34-1194(+)
MGDDRPAMVIDFGSALVKAGLAGRDVPDVMFATVAGRPQNTKKLFKTKADEEALKELYLGDEALETRGKLLLTNPVDHGIVKDWDLAQKLFELACQKVGVQGEDQPFLLTEPPYNPRVNRERMCQIVFEGLNGPSINFIPATVCSLTSAGRTTGLVVDSGDGVTHTVPIYEGYPIGWAVNRLNLGGRDVTEYLARLLYERGFTFTKSGEKETVREIKEKCCFLSENYRADMERAEKDPKWFEQEHKLPDGSVIRVGTERFRCTEVLFQPELISMEAPPLDELAHKSAVACDIDMRKTLMANVVLAGGNTSMSGIAKRLQAGLTARAPTGLFSSVKVLEPPERKISAWIGGAMIATLPSFQKQWISKAVYEEEGVHTIHKKCFNCVA